MQEVQQGVKPMKNVELFTSGGKRNSLFLYFK